MTDDTLTDRLGPFNFATFDRSRRYRYALGRTWDPTKPTCAFVMLNPSTADAFQLDPTIRRCIGFATRWGYGSLLVGNLFALRSTDPAAIYRERDPVGSANDLHLRGIWERSEIVVTAWGNHGSLGDRSTKVMGILGDIRTRHLGLTGSGQPRHPLYMRGDVNPVAYGSASEL